MPRVKLSPKRAIECKPTNVGHIIIFCEGSSEEEYFNYFAQILEKNKYNDIQVKLETAGGNAQGVLNFANNFLAQAEQNTKFSTYGKYLAFDCDAPPTIQNVITNAVGYELLVTNKLFETWLLMHFENVDTPLTKTETERRLSEHLRLTYKKGAAGLTRKTIVNGSVEEAINNARTLANKYISEEKSHLICIEQMNPYTTVWQLVEQFMAQIS